MPLPLLLIACRLLQGLSVGGEFPAAITFLAEHSPPRHRGFFSSFSFMGINMGLLSASAMQALLSQVLTPAQLTSFGWRIAFAIGAVLAMGSYWIRRQLAETPVFIAQKTQHALLKYPLLHSVRHEGLHILRAAFIIAAFTASIPTVLIFMPNYLSDYLHVPLTKALYMNTCNAFIFILLIPLMGALSDYIGRKAVLICGAGGFIVLSLPCYHLIQSHSTALMMTGMIGLIVCTALMTGGMAPTLAEFFANSTRATSVALAYNISVALFGGTSLIIITTLFHLTGQLQAPAWVMMSVGALSLLSIMILKFPQQKNL